MATASATDTMTGPPSNQIGFLAWMRKNLFNNIWNTMHMSTTLRTFNCNIIDIWSM